ncbi:MAG: peptidase [Paracoccus sp. (in: a-proteobacteria)]|nr:peptidase [Paracoccus sp. (in: a-proteobacteria)]
MSAARPEIADEARRWIGTPYVHQASCLGAGADCLGLVRGVWRAVCGAEAWVLPLYAPDWGELAGGPDLEAALMRHLVPLRPDAGWPEGQVLLFRMRDAGPAKHLGISSGSAAAPAFIHAYERHGVVESPLSLPWRRRIAGRFAFPGGAASHH